MGITTKTGDKGKTSLYRGKRVSKDDVRIEACGILDELCSYLGMSKSLIKSEKQKKIIESIQKDLFIIGTEVATEARFISRLKKRIKNTRVDYLEASIRKLEKKGVSREHCFHLPGQNLLSSTLDISRTISRKLERRVVTLRRHKMLGNEQILIYLNRLSDYLYLLARFHDKNL